MESAIDHDVVVVDEFDALSIEVKTSAEPVESVVSVAPIPTKFPAKLHARKVAAELNASDGLVFLPGEPSRSYEDSDMGPAFRQRRYFYYLSGANFADCAVTYELASDRLILWIPYVEPRQVLWFGSTPGISECLKQLDVDDVRYTTQLNKFLYRHLTPGSTLYVLHADQVPPLLHGDLLQTAAEVRVDTTSLQPAADQARVVKTEYEVAMIRKAAAVSAAAHRKVAERLLKLGNESEIEAIFQAWCTTEGAREQSYAIIAGSGRNASTLHYDANDEPLEGREVVVFDAGCEWHCYASDITRTLPISGRFSTESRAVYDVVARMQDECIARIRPGTLFFDLHVHASRVAQAGLLKLGVLRGDPAEVWDAGTVAAFFPHGLGHHVGLEVHDVSGRERLLLLNKGTGGRVGKREVITPEMMSAMAQAGVGAGVGGAAAAAASVPPPYRGRQYLRKNMIVTVEPGIYFCREYIEGYFLSNPRHARFINKAVLERYYRVGGVRIEDDILVTDDGYENLSTGAPKGEELLRVINGKA
ncbi:metallopeptidase family M24 [Colletotrichum abscissum]|uniref:Xaa-Pro aminopeptidase n=1 Tax=Colletotrichum abscissum TaxID=1671311 RepID=A0A9P9XK08_9PEZI|nr:metallopeptidase family M24 [Colletotrichum abscissum]KAI3555159.1 metallopeptidase family M24 [Colletotrichum abscissum]KAK1508997.1 metallopeptidase family M24 [Colletotrichum abscissum]